MPRPWTAGPAGRDRRRRRRRPSSDPARTLIAAIDRLEARTLLDGATGPIISEFVASNSTGLQDEDGDRPDWLEIYNPTAASVNLGGWTLTDDPDSPEKWTFPDTPLDAGAFLVVFASGKNRAVAGQELHTNFKLGASGEYLALDQPDGTVASAFSPSYPQQATDISYGVKFDAATLVAPGAAASVKVPTDGTLENVWASPSYTPDASWTTGPTGVGYGILQPGFNVQYVKANVNVGSLATAEQVLATPSMQSASIQTSADTINYLGTGSGANFADDRAFPTQTIGQDVDNFVLKATGIVTIPAAGLYSFGVNSDDGFGLTLSRNGQTFTMSEPDPRGAADTINAFNIPQAGQWNVSLTYYENGGGSEVEVYAAAGDHPSFDGGIFHLLGDNSDGGLAVGSVLTDDPGDSALVGQFVADDLNTQADGSAVGSWTDRDPDHNGAVTANAQGTPRLVKNTLNGHSVVRFASTDADNLRIAAAVNPLAGAGDFSAAVVFRTSTPGIGAQGDWYANSGLVDAEQAGETDDWGLAFDADGQVAAGMGNPDVSTYSQGAALDDGQAHLAVITRDSGVLSVYVDGKLMESRTDAGVDPRNVADLVLGSIQTNVNYFNGDIAEVRLYNDALTGNQIQRLATVLNATYGLPDVVEPTLATDIGAAMQGVNSTAYVRIPFTAPDVSGYDALTLQMQYDDGFVAYINGVEVARSNAPATLAYNSSATAARAGDPAVSQSFSLAPYLGLLHAGTNLLAIRGLNVSASDGDFLVRPTLVASKVYTDQFSYFATPTPGGPNQGAIAGMVQPVAASVGRGFFSAPFTVALTESTAGATIRYTLDGSEPTATNGSIYTVPLSVSSTTTLRAAAFENGYLTAPSIAETYIFLDDVIHQSEDGSAPAGWPTSWGNNVVDYGMDPDIVNNPTYGGAALEAALKAIPTISLTTNLSNLFDPSTGIYANAYQQGQDWERPASVELIDPSGKTSQQFQIDAGLRIRGGYSRSGGNPKHAFRLFFRSEYGASALNFPLFGTEGTDSFAKVDLRTAENYSWSFDGSKDNNFVAELFSRETMRDLSDPYTRSRFYQLYIDGQYWGLYQTEERPDANYAASYFGGDADNYDVVKVESGPYTIQATDGNLDAWQRLWEDVTDTTNPLSSNANYLKLLGKNPDGTDNPAYEVLVDPGELADYMITILYGGNLDAPISWFLGNQAPNNFFAIRDRTGRQGFQFIIHDAEHTLLNTDQGDGQGVNENRNGPYPAGQNFSQFNPQYLHQQLMANAEYRQLFADHVQKAFFNGGALTPASAEARFRAEAGQIGAVDALPFGSPDSSAIDGESARWGDAKVATAYTVADWRSAVHYVLDDYMPRRSAIVLGQFEAVGLFPSLAAPIFQIDGTQEHGGTVRAGDLLSFAAPGALVYYTLDGSDPRLIGGGISPKAIVYDPASSAPIALSRTSLVTARAFASDAWSAIDSAQFNLNVPASSANLRVTELDYHPGKPTAAEIAASGITDQESYEFIELLNTSDQEINLAGVKFTTGIAFDFTNSAITTLAPGAYVLAVNNLAAFQARYGTGLPVAGAYGGATGGLAHLSNSGEEVKLVDASGATIEDFTYGTTASTTNPKKNWPTTPDGKGPSLVDINLAGDPNDSRNWLASAIVNGSPGSSGNTPPTLSAIAPLAIDEDTSAGPLAFTVGDAETAAGSLIVTVSSTNPTLLPAAGLTLGGTGASRTLQITPAPNGNGTAVVTVSVSDGQGGTTSTSFTLTVNPVDDAPVGVPDGPYSGPQDAVLVVAATVGVLANDTDVDYDPLTAIVDMNPTHGTLVLNLDGSFAYTPAAGYVGPDSFTYHPNDGTLDGNSVTVSLNVTHVNHAPVAVADSYSTAEEAPLNVPASTGVLANDSDPDRDPITAILDAGPAHGTLTLHLDGSFLYTPAANYRGSDSFTYHATDGTLSSAAVTVSLSVTPVNHPPVLSPIANASVGEGSPLTFTATATDVDAVYGDTVSYSLDPGAPAGATIDPTTGRFSFTPNEDQGGIVYRITVRATDSGSPALSSAQTFTVTVIEVNSPPTLAAIADQTVAEGSPLTLTASATDPDTPAQAITYTLAAGAPAGATIDPASGAFSWTPTHAQSPGTYAITVVASDNGSPALSVSQTFRVSVTAVNHAPSLPTIADRSAVAGQLIRFAIAATDPDLPAQAITYTLAAGAPAGATIDPASGVFSWTPSGSADVAITVVATDSGSPPLSASATFRVRVVSVNHPPVLASIPDGSVSPGATFHATASATDPDAEDHIRYSFADGAPAGATIDPTTGAIAWTPVGNLIAGRYGFTVVATDDGSPALSAYAPFAVSLSGTGAIALVAPSSPVAAAGGVLALDLPLSAPGSTGLSATVDYGDGSGVQNAAMGDGVVHLTHAYDPSATSSYTVTVRVVDGSGNTGAATLVIAATALPPVTVTTGLVGVGRDGRTSIALSFTGPVADASTLADYSLVWAGRDHKLGTRDDRTIRLGSASYDSADHVVTLKTRGRVPRGLPLRLSVAADSILDSAHRPIDGDHDNRAGGSYSADLARRTVTIASPFRVRAHRVGR